MKAVRLHKYDERPRVEELPDPKIQDPLDVIVRIGGAGLCRTDLHIVEGQWADKTDVRLPYTLGHENAGWVLEVGSAVTNVAAGDTVILHPLVTCGLCRACRAGDDVHCDLSRFPGIDSDGGMGELLKTGRCLGDLGLDGSVLLQRGRVGSAGLASLSTWGLRLGLRGGRSMVTR